MIPENGPLAPHLTPKVRSETGHGSRRNAFVKSIAERTSDFPVSNTFRPVDWSISCIVIAVIRPVSKSEPEVGIGPELIDEVAVVFTPEPDENHRAGVRMGGVCRQNTPRAAFQVGLAFATPECVLQDVDPVDRTGIDRGIGEQLVAEIGHRPGSPWRRNRMWG